MISNRILISGNGKHWNYFLMGAGAIIISIMLETEVETPVQIDIEVRT